MSYTTYIATSNAFILKWISEHLQFVWIFLLEFNNSARIKCNVKNANESFSVSLSFLFWIFFFCCLVLGKIMIVLLLCYSLIFGIDMHLMSGCKFLYTFILYIPYMSHKLNVPAQNNYFNLISNMKYEK